MCFNMARIEHDMVNKVQNNIHTVFLFTFFQIEPSIFEQTQNNLDPSMNDALIDTFGVDWLSLNIEDLFVPLYSGLAARLWLQMTANPPPGNLTEQAEYWADVYNPNDNTRSMLTYLDEVAKLDHGIYGYIQMYNF